MKSGEHGNWHMKSRLLKYNEDIDSYAHRNSPWARVLRKVKPLFLLGSIASFIYDRTVGKLEREFHATFQPYEVIEQEGNCLLNTGIDEIWDIVTGIVSGVGHIFTVAAAYVTIGVGDDDTAAQATDTDLIGSNKFYAVSEAGYPTSTTQKVTFKSSFATGEANYAWQEWVVKHATSAICLNRKVESLGTKASGTWTLEVSITLS